MKKLASFIILVFLAWFTPAQQKEASDFYLLIAAIDSRDGSRIEVTINFGTLVGITTGIEGDVWGAHYSEFPEHNEKVESFTAPIDGPSKNLENHRSSRSA